MSDQSLRIIGTEVFVGANVHAPIPLVRLTLALGALKDTSPANLGDRFRRHCEDLLPNASASPEMFDAPGSGFARLAAEIALDLQRHLGAQVGYCRVDHETSAASCAVVYELWDAGVARPAAQLAVELLLRLLDASKTQQPWHAGQERERMLKQLRPQALDLITMAMVREAVKRRIPWYRLVPRKPFVQFGQGSRQAHIRESATHATSSTGRYLSKDKNATNALLERVGIPVPPQRLVGTVEEAIAAAELLGFPVVTKPLDRGNGKGVSVGLRDADGVRWGCGEAMRYGESVIVERFVAGDDHRILVVDGRMVAAAKRIPGHVVGDGERTIAQLVEVTNADPRRGTEYDQVMVRLEFDAQAVQVLVEAGLTRDSIPARGQIVPLRRTANVSTGGTCEDVTDRVHPDNRDAAVRASRVLGLNVAGVDFLTTDITRSYREIGGGICEVNFSPGLRPHWNANPDRDVVGPIVDTMFPAGAASRIPVVGMMGPQRADAACRLLAHILARSGHQTGVATAHGLEIGGRLMAAGDHTGPDGAAALVFDPSVNAAVLECPAHGILAYGLAIDRLDVAAVLPEMTEKVREIPSARGEAAPANRSAARVLVDAAERAVILSIDDPRCRDLAHHVPIEHLVLVSPGVGGDVLRMHTKNGGRAVEVYSTNNDLALALHAAGGPAGTLPLPAGFDSPTTDGGLERTALCVAIASAWALGIDADRIRSSLASLRAPV